MRRLLAALAMVVAGGVLIYFGIHRTYRHMRNATGPIEFSTAMALFGPVLLLGGIGLLIAALPPIRRSGLAKGTLILFAALGFAAGAYAAFFWLPDHQANSGY